MKLRVFTARSSAFSLAMAVAFPAIAQTSSNGVLKEVVVTATRSDSRVQDVIADVTVMTRADIELSTGRTLSELLARSAGVQTSSNGGLGKNSNVFIRGTDGRHTLLLVDGVRYGSSTSGTPNFDTIPLEMIERVEVLKGPASALYGSDAIGGVVQIFTRKGVPGFVPYASITVGENDRSEVSAGLQAGSGEFQYAFGVQSLRDKGFSASNFNAPAFTYNPDSDAFSQASGNASFAWNIANGWKVNARALQSDGTSQSDSGASKFDTRTEYSTSVLGLGVEGELLTNWKSRLSLGSSKDNSRYYSSATPSRFNTQKDLASWQNDLNTSLGTVVAGIENLKEAVDSTTAYTVNSRTTDSLFAGLTGIAGLHTWQVNGRLDHNSQFGDASTGLVGYGYALSEQLRAKGSYGTTFRAPSFNDLYYPNYGDPTLQPETGRNAEVGLSYSAGLDETSVTYFVNRIQNYITTANVAGSVPSAKIQGVSVAYTHDGEALSYRAALNLLDARNEQTLGKLPRRPDAQLTSAVDYRDGRWTYGVSLLAASESYDDAANKKTLGGYATVDLNLAYALEKNWSIEGRVVNVGDKNYQTANGYNQLGRAAYVTLRYQPK